MTTSPIARHRSLFLIAALGLIVLLLGAGYMTWLRDPAYAFRGGELDTGGPAPALDLTDQHGQPFSLGDHRGEIVMLYFGYTACPDFCPATLTDFETVKAELGDNADRVTFAMITVDSARDTPERLNDYLASFDPAFVGLTGSHEEITAASRAYGVFAAPHHTGHPAAYMVDHTTATYVIDPAGTLRLTYAWDTDPADIVSDIEHLLDT